MMIDSVGIVLACSGTARLKRTGKTLKVEPLLSLYADDLLELEAGASVETLLFATQGRWRLTASARSSVKVARESWPPSRGVMLQELGRLRGRRALSLPPLPMTRSGAVRIVTSGAALDPSGRLALSGEDVPCRWKGLDSSLPTQLILWKTLATARSFQRSCASGLTEITLPSSLLTPGISYSMVVLQKRPSGGKRCGYTSFTPLSKELAMELEELLQSATTPLLRAVGLESYGLLEESLVAYREALRALPSALIRQRIERLTTLLQFPEPRS